MSKEDAMKGGNARTLHVQAEMERMAAAGDRLRDRLTSLRNRLSPIVRAIPAAPAPSDKLTEESIVPLADEIRAERRRMESIISDIDDIMDNLQI